MTGAPAPRGGEPVWTTPYYGVQHLRGLLDGWQITVEEPNRCYVLSLHGPHPFTPFSETWADNVAKARAWGE